MKRILKPLGGYGNKRSPVAPTLGKLDSFAASDIGKRRETNEDQFLVADLARTAKINSTSLSHDDDEQIVGRTHAKLMLVADGMGGHAAGRRASMLAADTALQWTLDRFPWVSQTTPATQKQMVEGLHCVVRQCQKAIIDDAAWNPRRRGMGTTLTMALLDWPTAYVAHVGDSRCYVCRNGKLIQLTKDHSYASALVEAGEMTAEQASRSQFSHTLWNVVGGHDASIEPCVDVHQLEIGDTLVLCTDGLTNHVDDERLEDVINSSTNAEQACERLVDLANADGGRDNITLVVARFVESNSYEEASIEEQETAKLDFTLSETTIQRLEDGER